ncbi:MAG: hypothetical protein ACKVW3_13930 [Phycisphaerales bacterium]
MITLFALAALGCATAMQSGARALTTDLPIVEYGSALQSVNSKPRLASTGSRTNNVMLVRDPTDQIAYTEVGLSTIRDITANGYPTALDQLDNSPIAQHPILPSPPPTIGPASTRPKWWWEYWRGRWPIRLTHSVTAGSGALTMPPKTTMLLEFEVATNRLNRIYLLRVASDNPAGKLSVANIPQANKTAVTVTLPATDTPKDWYVTFNADGEPQTPIEVTDSSLIQFLDLVRQFVEARGVHTAFPQ